MRWSGIKRTVCAALVGVLAGGGSAWADFTLGEPTNLGPTVNRGEQWDVCISADGLLLLWGSDTGGYGNEDIWMATRATPDDPWSEAVNLGPTINTPSGETDPSLSADGLTLYFRSNRPGGVGGDDLWVTTRANTESQWETPTNLGSQVNSEWDEGKPSISGDGLSLYFSDYSWWLPTSSPRPGGQGGGDIWVTTRVSKDDPWGAPVNLGPLVNSSALDHGPSISADGLTLFFHSERPGGLGYFDLWMSRRHTRQGVWGEPVNLGAVVNGKTDDQNPCISADGSALYYDVGWNRHTICRSQIIRIVDFNGDGKVDGCELCTMADRWGTDDSLCDIGPMPWGDGVVDVEDLKVLARHIGESVDDPTLVGHWALDETEGVIAHDSTGENDGTVMGVPAWQPDGGKVGGTLEFDGATFVAVGSVLDPSDGPFSVLAWVRGGSPGQVVFSQFLGTNWLMADASNGALMTELRAPTRDDKRLVSETVITDGNWHRVALVWDGTLRSLYVDDLLAAQDSQSKLAGSGGGLHIGCDKNRTPGSFWSGLIDEVRIYNRAVKP